jgi:hypothetical protein
MDQISGSYFRFDTLDPISEKWQAVAQYHAAIEERLPEGARRFTCADWHYNYQDPRCPHDSWLRNIHFRIAPDEPEILAVGMEFLGAFHDRMIVIEYENVTNLSINGQLLDASHNVEWIYDEIHLLPSGRVEHVIELSQCFVRIEFTDLEYRSEVFPGH